MRRKQTIMVSLLLLALVASGFSIYAWLHPSTCGEGEWKHLPQGTVFNMENGALRSNTVRTIYVDDSGQVFGGHGIDPTGTTQGLFVIHDNMIAYCPLPGGKQFGHINAIINDDGKLYVGMDNAPAGTTAGLQVFMPWDWADGTSYIGDPRVYDLFRFTEGKRSYLAVTTWDGVTVFGGRAPPLRYTTRSEDPKYRLASDPTHAVMFSTFTPDRWFGSIKNGVTWIKYGMWPVHLLPEEEKSTEPNTQSVLRGKGITEIIENPADQTVWIASGIDDQGKGGGIDVYHYRSDSWSHYTDQDGLPSSHVNDMAIDKYGRVWAATVKGLAYLDKTDKKWHVVNTDHCFSVAVTPDGLTMWAGTQSNGAVRVLVPTS